MVANTVANTDFIMNSLDTSSFTGVWKRTKLFEPRGTLGPEEEQIKCVLWVQSRTGEFIDLRVPDKPFSRDCDNLLELKSFAGKITFDSLSAQLTWHRLIDLRHNVRAQPDVGLINFLSTDQIEEDGVLPGDDYKEVWDRIGHANVNPESNCVASLEFCSSCGDNAAAYRMGFFLIVGDYFACTVSRPKGIDGDIESASRLLEGVFESGNNPDVVAGIATDDAHLSYLWQYFTVVGKVSDWKILYSLHPNLIGTFICPTAAAAQLTVPETVVSESESAGVSAEVPSNDTDFIQTLMEAKWTISHGHLPSALEQYLS